MKKLLTFLTFLLVAVAARAGDESVFSAVASAAHDYESGTTEITSEYATISGGKMYAISGQESAKSLIKTWNKVVYFCHTNNNTYFKVVLDEPLAVGDVITADALAGVKKDGDGNVTGTKGLLVSTIEGYPSYEPECSVKEANGETDAVIENLLNYTVTAGSEYVGATTIYIYRAAGATEYFTNFKITRAASAVTTYTVAGAVLGGAGSEEAGFFGEKWDPTNTANDMTEAEGGIFIKKYEDLELSVCQIQFKVVENHAWDNAYPSDNYQLMVSKAGKYDLTITFNPEGNTVNAQLDAKNTEPEITSMEIRGTFPGMGWNDEGAVPMTLVAGSTTQWTATMENVVVEGQTYEYKAFANNATDGYQLPAEGNKNFAFGTEAYPAGTYNLTFNVDTQENSLTLTAQKVEDPEPVINSMEIRGTFPGMSWDAEGAVAMSLVDGSTTIWTVTLENVEVEAKAYEYKAFANQETTGYQLPAEGNESLEFGTEQLPAGKYNLTFIVDTENDRIAVRTAKVEEQQPDLKDFTVAFKTNTGWEKVYAYAWSGEGEAAIPLNVWPGAEITASFIDGAYIYTFKAAEAPEKIIFNNGQSGEGNQTADLDFVNEKIYEHNVSQTQKYTITIAEGIANGTVVSDKAEAEAGETITLTITPAEGYELEKLNVTDAEENVVEVGKDNTFTMPAANVTISASFKQASVQIEGLAIIGDFTGGWPTQNAETQEWDWSMAKPMTHIEEQPAIWALTIEGFEAEAKTYEFKAAANGKWGDYELPANGNKSFQFGTDEYPAGKYDLLFKADTEKNTLTLFATKVEEPQPDPVFIVAGNNADIFGAAWDTESTTNTLEIKDGKYYRTYTNVQPQEENIELKAYNKTNDKWFGNTKDGGNVKFNMKAAGDFTVVLDVNADFTAGNVWIEGDNVQMVYPEPEQPVTDVTWTVAGDNVTLFGASWDPSVTANDMVKGDDGLYKWEKIDAELAQGEIQFKVVKNHAWGEEYPSSNYNLTIAEDAKYTITITFNPETKEVVATPTKTGEAVIPDAEITSVQLPGDWNWALVKGEDNVEPYLVLTKGENNTWTGVLDLTEVTTDQKFKLVINKNEWLGLGELTLNAGELVSTNTDKDNNFILLNATSGYKTYDVTASWEANANAKNGWTLTIAGKDERTVATEPVYTLVGDESATFLGDAMTVLEANNLEKIYDGFYKKEYTGINLEAGNVKVWAVKDGDLNNLLPRAGFTLEIPAAGVYDLTFTFHSDDNVLRGEAEKKDDAKEVILAENTIIAESETLEVEIANNIEVEDGEIITIDAHEAESAAPLRASRVLDANDITIKYKPTEGSEWTPADVNLETTETGYQFMVKGDLATAINARGFAIEAHKAIVVTEIAVVEAPATPELNTYTATFTTTANWEKVYAYAWSGEGEAVVKFLGDWPGTELTKNAETGLYEVSIKAENAPANIIFNNGNGGEGNQTADLAFENGGAYSYMIEVPVTHTWDFTQWSEATVRNLKADAAASKLEGWSDVEKKADAEADADPTEASKDNCFWAVIPEGGELTANGETIEELKGLEFNATYAGNRSLAIAVNYPETSLGTYHGPTYLWLGGGGKNVDCFVIKNVKAGTTIKMGVESHKNDDGRGVQLFIDNAGARGAKLMGTDGNEVAVPKTYEDQEWVVAGEEGEVVNVIVYNTKGCHIYYIDAEIGEAPEPPVEITGYYLCGNFWATEEDTEGFGNFQEMTKQENGLYTFEIASFENKNENSTYEYKLTANETWGVFELPASGNYSFFLGEVGNYKITFTANVTDTEIDGIAPYSVKPDAEKLITDGIASIKAAQLEGATVYTLQGVRVNNVKKGGMYIVNGRKVAIK